MRELMQNNRKEKLRVMFLYFIRLIWLQVKFLVTYTIRLILRLFYHGHKGISKTVSIFLFWRLAKYIDAYRFIDGENVEDEFYDVPKMVYWTVKKKDNIKSVRKNILNQC